MRIIRPMQECNQYLKAQPKILIVFLHEGAYPQATCNRPGITGLQPCKTSLSAVTQKGFWQVYFRILVHQGRLKCFAKVSWLGKEGKLLSPVRIIASREVSPGQREAVRTVEIFSPLVAYLVVGCGSLAGTSQNLLIHDCTVPAAFLWVTAVMALTASSAGFDVLLCSVYWATMTYRTSKPASKNSLFSCIYFSSKWLLGYNIQ